MREESTVWSTQPTPSKTTWVNSNPFLIPRLDDLLAHVSVVGQVHIFTSSPMSITSVMCLLNHTLGELVAARFG